MPLISVSQLNNYMKRYVEQNVHLSDLWIKGEISNLKVHYSGHIYMSLKDESSNIRAIMFNSYAEKQSYIPKNGDKVIAFGKVRVFERDGIYQLYVESLVPDGIGDLYAAYEKLKKDLHNEGLFDVKHKKTIPQYPKYIGVISSVSGAALRDIMNVISRRYTLCDICIFPVKVQGVGSADTICEALDFFSGHPKCDVIILARGGGSLEDLWTYNEEKTARAIFRCKKPVVTGIGHETDYTISDFVADLRAPTPSAAAELVTPSMNELSNKIINNNIRIKNYIDTYIGSVNDKLLSVNKNAVYNRIKLLLDKYNSTLGISKAKLLNVFNESNAEIIKKLTSLSSALNAMSPKKVLQRGYSIIADEENNPLRPEQISSGDNINVVHDNGFFKCKVTEVHNNGE